VEGKSHEVWPAVTQTAIHIVAYFYRKPILCNQSKLHNICIRVQ